MPTIAKIRTIIVSTHAKKVELLKEPKNSTIAKIKNKKVKKMIFIEKKLK